MSASIRLLRHQGPMLNVIANLLYKSIKRNRSEIKEHNLKSTKDNITLNPKIVSEYHKWLGAEKSYNDTVAPHLFPLWSYPQLFKLGKELNLPLHKVLNQGVKLIINDDVGLKSPLTSKVEIFKVQNLESKYKINQSIITQTPENPNALIAEIYAVILKDSKIGAKKSKSTKTIDTSKFTSVKSLYISKKDAQSYAYLSGDINPIHLSKNIAKLMGLKGSIMHGFGLFAILFENLQQAGFKLKEIDIRFLNPVYLNSYIEIFVVPKGDNKFGIRILNHDHTMVHLSGEFKIINRQ